MGRRWEGDSRKRGHMYTWLIHVDVWQKSSQYCKQIINQFKINSYIFLRFWSIEFRREEEIGTQNFNLCNWMDGGIISWQNISWDSSLRAPANHSHCIRIYLSSFKLNASFTFFLLQDYKVSYRKDYNFLISPVCALKLAFSLKEER